MKTIRKTYLYVEQPFVEIKYVGVWKYDELMFFPPFPIRLTDSLHKWVLINHLPNRAVDRNNLEQMPLI